MPDSSIGASVTILVEGTPLDPIIVDNLTFSAGTRVAGLINLNTASVNVLATLPNVELTLLVGGYAQRWALGAGAGSMTDAVAAWRAGLPAVLPLPHPSWRNTAWLRRNAWFETDVTPYLRQRVSDMLGR